jgi:site-specific DNA recombinase
MSEQWQLEQDELTVEIARHQTADRTYLNEGTRLIELAQGAHWLFAKQKPSEQRRLLNFVLSNSTWKNGELTPAFRQPFDLIAEVATKAKDQEGGGALNSSEHPVWLTTQS